MPTPGPETLVLTLRTQLVAGLTGVDVLRNPPRDIELVPTEGGAARTVLALADADGECEQLFAEEDQDSGQDHFKLRVPFEGWAQCQTDDGSDAGAIAWGFWARVKQAAEEEPALNDQAQRVRLVQFDSDVERQKGHKPVVHVEGLIEVEFYTPEGDPFTLVSPES